MPASRYRNLNIIDDKYYETSTSIPRSKLDSIQTVKIRITAEDRLDTLAAKYLGSGEYWWVIADMNDLKWAWDFTPGQIIKIPIDVDEVLRLI